MLTFICQYIVNLSQLWFKLTDIQNYRARCDGRIIYSFLLGDTRLDPKKQLFLWLWEWQVSKVPGGY